MHKYITRALLGALVLSGACKEGLSAPSQDALVAGSSQAVQNLVTGILATDRGQASAFSYLLYGETMARNSARIDPNEPRFINELIAVPIDNSDFIGTLRMDRRIPDRPRVEPAVDRHDARRDGAGGSGRAFAVSCRRSRRWTTSESSSCAIRWALPSRATIRRRSIHSGRRVPCSRTSRPLLDSGYANLTAGGVDATVPVTMPSGYKSSGDYTKTANLALFNRGLAGEVAVMRGFDRQTPCSACFAAAITALNAALTRVRRDADRRAARAGTVL